MLVAAPWYVAIGLISKGEFFRFALGNKRAVIGNKRRPLDAATRDRVRIADVVAASSCFPGAFEPLVFPTDFRGEDLHLVGHGPIGLMDGGISPNFLT